MTYIVTKHTTQHIQLNTTHTTQHKRHNTTPHKTRQHNTRQHKKTHYNKKQHKTTQLFTTAEVQRGFKEDSNQV